MFSQKGKVLTTIPPSNDSRIELIMKICDSIVDLKFDESFRTSLIFDIHESYWGDSSTHSGAYPWEWYFCTPDSFLSSKFECTYSVVSKDFKRFGLFEIHLQVLDSNIIEYFFTRTSMASPHDMSKMFECLKGEVMLNLINANALANQKGLKRNESGIEPKIRFDNENCQLELLMIGSKISEMIDDQVKKTKYEQIIIDVMNNSFIEKGEITLTAIIIN